jgi:hypothetical protein
VRSKRSSTVHKLVTPSRTLSHDLIHPDIRSDRKRVDVMDPAA